jgi:hypothetical protein
MSIWRIRALDDDMHDKHVLVLSQLETAMFAVEMGRYYQAQVALKGVPEVLEELMEMKRGE